MDLVYSEGPMAQGLETPASGRHTMARHDYFISDAGSVEVTSAALFHRHEAGSARSCAASKLRRRLAGTLTYCHVNIDLLGKMGAAIEHARFLVGPLHRRSGSPAICRPAAIVNIRVYLIVKLLLLVVLGTGVVLRGVVPAFTAIPDDFPEYFTSATIARETQD